MQKFIFFIYEKSDLHNFLNFIPKSILFAGNLIVSKTIDRTTTSIQKMVGTYYQNVDYLKNSLSKFSNKFLLKIN